MSAQRCGDGVRRTGMSAQPLRPAPAAGRITSVAVLLVTLIVVSLIVSACTSGGSGAPGVGASLPYAPANGDAAGGDTSGREQGDIAAATDDERKVARTASITLEVPDADAAAIRVRELTAAREGYVTRESLSVRESGSSHAWATIAVSIPAAELDAFLADIAGVGAVRHRELTADDVTDEVVDTDARIRVLEASIARVTALMDRAGTVTEIAQVESELARRQAELESLTARQEYLSTITERATVWVTLQSAPVDTTNPFRAGLLGGWDALGASARALLVVVGALLPFAAVLALVGGPVVWWLSRRRSARAGSAAHEAPAADGAAGA